MGIVAFLARLGIKPPGKGNVVYGLIGGQVKKILTPEQLRQATMLVRKGEKAAKPTVSFIKKKGEDVTAAMARVTEDLGLTQTFQQFGNVLSSAARDKRFAEQLRQAQQNKLPIPQGLRSLVTQGGREIARRVTGRNPIMSTGGGGRGATSPFPRPGVGATGGGGRGARSPFPGRIMNPLKGAIPGLTTASDINRNQPRPVPQGEDFPLGPPGIGGPPFRESPMDTTFDPREIPEPGVGPIAEDFIGQKLFGLRRSRQEIDRDMLATKLLEGNTITFKGKKYKPGQVDAFMNAANETILDTPLTKRTKKIKSRRDTKGRQVTTLAEDVARVLKPKKKMTGGKVYASSIRKPKTLI